MCFLFWETLCLKLRHRWFFGGFSSDLADANNNTIFWWCLGFILPDRLDSMYMLVSKQAGDQTCLVEEEQCQVINHNDGRMMGYYIYSFIVFLLLSLVFFLPLPFSSVFLLRGPCPLCHPEGTPHENPPLGGCRAYKII